MDRQIGVAGAGTIGAGVGQFFGKAGWRVAISGAHGPDRGPAVTHEHHAQADLIGVARPADGRGDP